MTKNIPVLFNSFVYFSHNCDLWPAATLLSKQPSSAMESSAQQGAITKNHYQDMLYVSCVFVTIKQWWNYI